MNVLFEIGFIVCVLVVISTGQDGYYWRDYTGNLPKDAIPAGSDGKGGQIYVGQTVHGEGVLPGSIRTDQKQIFYEFGNKEHSTIKNVKILCSIYPKQFNWIRTSAGNSLADLTRNQSDLIPAGTTFVVGRVFIVQDEIVIGKVLIKDKFDLMWVSRNGISWTERSYEVLVYQTNIIHEPEVPHTPPQMNITYETEVPCVKQPIVINIY